MTEEICLNCKYFERHYAWVKNSFTAVNCGHCSHEKGPKNERLNYPSATSCKYFQGEKDNKRSEIILEELKKLISDFNEIKEIFCDK